MTRTIGRATLLFALTASLGGCTTVRVARPVGAAPVPLDAAEWNGTWCDAKGFAPAATPPTPGEDCLSLTVVDPDAGVLDVVSPSEPGEPFRAHLRYAGGDREAILVSVEDHEAFTFELRARRDAGLLLAWSVAGDAVAREVRAGRIAGRVDEGSVDLAAAAPAVLARLAAGDGDLYDWTHPIVLVRVRE